MAQPAKQQGNLGKVLVIGGNGMLGHHIVKLLLSSWTASVSVIDLKCELNRLDGVAYYEADITDVARLNTVFDKVRPDVVIHTASPAPQAASAVSKELFKKVNVDGTAAIIEACQKSGVKALVYTSSASIMTDNKSDLMNANEEFPVYRGAAQPEYYSETKAQADELVLKANRQAPYKLLTTSIRPAGIFGEGDTMTIKHLVNIYLDGKTNFQVGDNNNLFDFTYAVNVAHAHLLAAQALLATHRHGSTVPLDTERVDGEAFLVTNDSPVYFWDFCRAVWRAAGWDSSLKSVWTIPTEIGIFIALLVEILFELVRMTPTFNRQRITYSSMTRYYSISKIKARLGYKPIVGLGEGINRSVKWYLDTNKEAAEAAAAKKTQ
ncbi:related to C-3 sterol dehydrogenase (C-4 decarboxylase) [Cephalotrichum gorgonifer]|uniref:Sterol-4-alpha-carboxylate 3-dehydrogenase ERG26, decarboxylating n=1 Tax=Cephalotrichum gorgonifer TaxID=2041049 RepID=A0AAE8MQF7_9PEZI|nr:related to C-3 sterol dehydrogenase (C-4 decarboxylase) [Cephalotrichum gorgonifer]